MITSHVLKVAGTVKLLLNSQHTRKASESLCMGLQCRCATVCPVCLFTFLQIQRVRLKIDPTQRLEESERAHSV